MKRYRVFTVAEVLCKSDSLPDAILKISKRLKEDNPKFKEKLFIKRICEFTEVSDQPTRAEVSYSAYPKGGFTKY